METLTRSNYYNYGDETNVVVSNSMMSVVNPDQGGSILRLRKYLVDREEEKYKLHLEKGRLLHAYLENPQGFTIFDGTKPSEIGIIEILNHVFADVREICKQTGTEIGTADIYTDIIEDAVLESTWRANWRKDTKVKKILDEGADYWNFLADIDDSHILTEAEYESLKGMTDSLEMSPYKDEILDYPGTKEVPITGTYQIATPGIGISGKVKTKGLMDMLFINGSTAVIDEVKTTGKPVSTFMGSRRVGFNSAGQVTEKWIDGQFHTFRYYRQLKFYANMIRENFSGISDIRHNMYVFETNPPYEIRKFEVANTAYWQLAEQEIARCMQQIGKYIKKFVIEEF